MIALGIIILILIIILLLPVGADAAYTDSAFSLKAKLGPIKIGLVPGKEKPEGKEKKSPKPGKNKKKKADTGSPEAGKKDKPKLKLGFDDIMTIIRIALRALGRFRRSIKVDKLMLHFVAGGSDPYSAVMSYGYFNAAIGALRPLLHRVFKIRNEDYASAVDFEADKLKIEGRIVLTVRIGEILLLVLCAVFAFLKWFLSYRRRNRNSNNEKITENSSAEKGN